MPISPSHQAFAALVAAGVALALPARPEDVLVPINLQAELLFMIAAQDKNLPERAG